MKKRILSFALVLLSALVLVGCKDKTTKAHVHVDENKDCLCDSCGETMSTHKPNPANNCICDTCGFDFHKDYSYLIEHVHNSVCDVCGKSFAKSEVNYNYVDSATCQHRDLDGNCVCDLCFVGMGHKFNEQNVCSVCGLHKRLEGNYTYNTSFSTSPTNWNPHTYQTADDGDVFDYLQTGLYGFYFDGSKEGYEMWPEMASAYPEDVTTAVKAMEGRGSLIPADATEKYAYKIRLNKSAKWEDGTPIKAVDWVESYKLLMDPELKNYRAADQTAGDVVIANCKEYLYQGDYELSQNYGNENFEVADLTKNDHGQYVTPDGRLVYIAISYKIAWCGGYSLAQYVNAYQDSYFNMEHWAELAALADAKDGVAPLTDESMGYLASVISTKAWNESEANVPCYLILRKEYAANYSFDNVGLWVDPTDEYAFYMVLSKPASGFYFLYGLGWGLVKVDAYKAGMSVDEITGVKTTNYNTSLATTHSYGPYVLSEYQLDKAVDFARNPNWYGYSDSRYDCMFQTSAIVQEKVTESSTRKEMFLKGELITYGLQAADYSEFGNSEYLYTSPGTTLFFMILAANEEVLTKIQTAGVNKTIICNADFRHAMSLAFNKSEFSKAISPARTPAYSVIGAYDIWNPNTGEKYRETEIAKKAIVEFFGYVQQENGKYKITGSDKEYTLDEANEAVTGYSPAVAKELFTKAYNEWKAAGKISDTDRVEIQYASSESSDFITKMLGELNRQLSRTLEGTPLEGRVTIVESAPLGDDWSDSLKSSESQTCLAGWKGGMLNPFGSMLYYLDVDHEPYANQWWHTEAVNMTLTLPVGENGADVEITTTLNKWVLMLTGDPQKVGEVTYNFGFEQVADDVRLTILAEMEKVILGTDYYIPFMQDASGFLLSKKVNYVLGRTDYNAVLGRGGITYLTYNYDDAAWAAYVASQEGGHIAY